MAKQVISSIVLLVLMSVSLSPSEGSTQQTWCGWLTWMVTAAGKTSDIPNIDKAAILGADGNVWTTEECADKVLTLNATEASALKSDTDDLQKKGFWIEGVQYKALQVSDKDIIGKRGRAAVYVKFTTQATLIGRMPEGGTVEKLRAAVGQ